MEHPVALQAAVEAALTKKAAEPVVLHTTKLTPVADYFLICSAQTPVQLEAVADELREALEGEGAVLSRQEGREDAGWVLLDYGWLVVHIMLPAMREFYQLERLWHDAERVKFGPIQGA